MKDNAISKPIVSIKVITFNRVNSLKFCISNILSQTYPNIEIFIFDDNSNDGTELFCKSIVNPRVNYFRNPINIGSIDNFRKALSFNRGDYSMVIADDDYLSSDYVEKCVEYLENQTDFPFVMGKTVWFTDFKKEMAQNNDLVNEFNLSRVFKYYSNPGRYTYLYSFYSTKYIKDIHVSNLAPFDWHLEASMSYIGKLRVLEDVFLYRSASGISSNKKQLFAFLNFTSYQKFIPFSIISINSAKHFLLNPIFKSTKKLFRYLVSICILIHCFYFYVIIHSTKLKIHFILRRIKKVVEQKPYILK